METIFIVDIRREQAGGRVQTEHGQLTKTDHERRERMESKKSYGLPRGSPEQDAKRPAQPK